MAFAVAYQNACHALAAPSRFRRFQDWLTLPLAAGTTLPARAFVGFTAKLLRTMTTYFSHFSLWKVVEYTCRRVSRHFISRRRATCRISRQYRAAAEIASAGCWVPGDFLRQLLRFLNKYYQSLAAAARRAGRTRQRGCLKAQAPVSTASLTPSRWTTILFQDSYITMRDARSAHAIELFTDGFASFTPRCAASASTTIADAGLHYYYYRAT